jgi:endonuclease/exonuclease/phosphatase family metal-dependent hydrolase
VRIVSYNILDGGIGRADPVAEVLQAQNADVIALIEADDSDVVTRIANRLGMDYVTAPGHGHSVALLSRLTITQSINHVILTPGPSRCLLEATVQASEGLTLPVFAVHFSAGAYEADEVRREAELATLLSVTEHLRSAQAPHVLAGDFNANSPHQRIDTVHAKPSTRKAFEANGRVLPRRVVAKLVAAGYVDTLHTFRRDTAHRQATFTTHEPQQRVDYVFAHGLPGDKIRDAWVEHDRLAKYASDHFPVGVDLDV